MTIEGISSPSKALLFYLAHTAISANSTLPTGLEALPLPSLIVAAVHAAFPSPEDEAVRALMFANVMLMGGLAELPGMQRRIELDVRALIDQDFLCRVQVIPT